MMGRNNQADKVSPPEQSRRTSGWIHFGLAAGLLLVAAVVWNIVLIGKYFAKKPVPPPPHAQFEEHRLTNFPKRIGQYVLAGDGELFEKRDGLPDGLLIEREENLETLGTLKNDWNWYYMAVYRDTHAAPGSSGRYIRLDITYYTGLLEAVPHVGERCIVAGGGTIIHGQSKPIRVRLDALPAAWKKWRDIEVYRTTYEIRRRDSSVTRASQYHIFGVNGKPICDWMKVRWDIGSLSLKYCYFAKIQIAVRAPESDVEKNDTICRKFIEQVLPEVLRFLASADDVKKMEDRD